MSRKNRLLGRMNNEEAVEHEIKTGVRATEEKEKSRRKEMEHTPLVRVKARKSPLRFIPVIALILVFTYICFLIYGLLYTTYESNENGDPVPVVYSVEELKLLDEYALMASYYNRIQDVYRQILDLDADLRMNPQNSLVISLQYTELLEPLEKIIVDLKAAEYEAKYSTVYTQFSAWCSGYTALYLQYISKAIANNDEAAMNNALVARKFMYNNFIIITANVATISSGIKGAHSYADFSWNPDEHYAKKINGGNANAG